MLEADGSDPMKRILAVASGAPAAALAYWFGLRPWSLRWGATDAERVKPLPGDDRVPHPKVESTRAVTIDAPPEDVWPWIAQIGQDRAGFYSYTWLENLVGCHMRNAGRLVPEWQDIAEGDFVWLHPKAPPLAVNELIPGRAMVLGDSCAFVLEPAGEGRTRFIMRGRGAYTPDLHNAVLNFVLWRVVYEPAHFIMERKMMLGIKQRAERLAREKRGRPAGVERVARLVG